MHPIAYTRKGLSSLDAPAACNLVYAELNTPTNETFATYIVNNRVFQAAVFLDVCLAGIVVNVTKIIEAVNILIKGLTDWEKRKIALLKILTTALYTLLDIQSLTAKCRNHNSRPKKCSLKTHFTTTKPKPLKNARTWGSKLINQQMAS